MTREQIIVFAVLGAALVLFLWNRIRYDFVALGALLVVTLTGVIPAAQAFSGFGNPAVVTVAAVLLISRGLLNAGVVDVMARQLTRVGNRVWAQVAVLTSLVAICSGFMNNTGALALFMPVAIWMSRQSDRSPGLLLMPLSFGSLLGGSLTLIGTPPNILVSTYRQTALGAGYKMFDFLPAGLAITVAGVAFISLIGWRLIPHRKDNSGSQDLFEVNAYLTELRLPEGSKFVGQTLQDITDKVGGDAEFLVLALYRDGKRSNMPKPYTVLRELDILLIEADADNIKKFMDVTGLELAPDAESRERTEEDRRDLKLMEAIVTPASMLVGQSANRLSLRDNHHVNVLAIAREGMRLRQRVDQIRFAGGDILLLQVHEDTALTDLNELGCLPLASRGLRIGQGRKVLLAAGSFALVIALIAANLVSAAVGMTACALAMISMGLIPLREVYETIEMPVLVLLAAMLPVGMALESSGGSKLLADLLLQLGREFSPAVMVAVLMAGVMLLGNVLNHSATAILAAPVAVGLATGLHVSPDPFLMAVVIGSSCPFLTPIGHQCNTLVMSPGGYKFGDYWKMGLPLSALCLACGTAAILWVWPL